MKAILKVLVRICVTLMVVQLMGCASVPMNKTDVINAPNQQKSIVTFVRQSIFLGDGVGFDLWDGERYIGVMKAGTIVQYETEPGKHLFMANGENWSYVTADLLPGKHYFIKANLYPGVWSARISLGVAHKDDERINAWLTEYTAMAVNPEDAAKYENERKGKVKAAIAEFNAGKITSYDTIEPEDGL